MKRNNQAGFTLIELIIVIVILGILAVTASPKFLDLQGDARGSTVEGLKASLQGASNITYSKALVQGQAGATGTTSNPTINVVHGYPKATVADMQAILDSSIIAGNNSATAQAADWEASVDNADSTIIRLYPEGGFDNVDATADTACYVSYKEAANSSTPPVITHDISGC